MYIFFLSLLLVYLVVTAVSTAQVIKSMKDTVVSEKTRLEMYRLTISQSWLFFGDCAVNMPSCGDKFL